MNKRLGIFLGIAAVSVLAAAGVFAGIAAQDGDADNGKRSFPERVAAILGLETETVEDAFTQAKDKIREEHQDAVFAKLVENGTLTQDEADAIEEWKDAQPEVTFNLSDNGRFGKRGFGSRGFGGDHGWMVISEDTLAALVEKEVLTQQDADALQGWYDDQPDAITKLMPSRGKWGHHGRWGKGKWGRDHGKGDDVETAHEVDA